MTPLTATSTFTSWDEEPGWGDDAPVPRLAHAKVVFAYTGDLEATSEAHFALYYRADGTGTSQGFEIVTGTRDGAEGTFVLHHVDDFDADGVRSTHTVVEGSGTGAFAGLTGSGSYQLGHGTKEWEWSLT
ncbi:DUF3224 domain-containing protein [Iamia sp. SCSIO 61187]|nr:DUF3224 domain-containing protein [Iamia sp. SCSIO 61187]